MPQELIFKLVTIIGPLILAITIHEFSHIAAARWLGDDLGTRMGRYTLDPLKHIDPMWTVGLPVILIIMSTLSGGMGIPFFAAGKPAPYNPMALNRRFFGKRIRIRTAELIIAAAGPLSNLVLAFLSLLSIYIMLQMGYHDTSEYSFFGLVIQFMYLNLALFIFNLIPIPPLDGSKVLAALLPHQTALKYEAIGGQFSWVLFALIIFGGGGMIGTLVYGVAQVMFKLIA